MNKQRVLLRALSFIPGLGPISLLKIIKLYPNLENLWLESNQQIAKTLNQNIANKITAKIHRINPSDLEKNINSTDIRYITILDKEYPGLLKEIYDPPIILYYKGDVQALAFKNKLAVVGARKMSTYGKQIIPHILSPICPYKIIIVSGMAIGVDGAAHQVAVNENCPTIAVLGSGIDNNSLYPKQNIQLAEKIIQNKGIIISEHPPGTRPQAEYFPRRNRIISGLCQASLIVEAAERSGSLITAYQALEQNRDVMAIPGNILLTNSLGTNKLLQRGARPIVQSKDILDAYSIGQMPPDKKIIKDLTLVEQNILSLLTDQNLTVDKLQQSSKIDIGQLNATLSIMEVKGLIKSSGGTYYSI